MLGRYGRRAKPDGHEALCVRTLRYTAAALRVAAGSTELDLCVFLDHAAKKQLFGKTQNPALAASRKMKNTVGVLGANQAITARCLRRLTVR